MTRFPDLFAALAAPFENHEVKLRNAPGGRQLHYITARTAMNRLDTVLGPENWWDEYVPLEHSVICKLSIRLVEDGEIRVVTKADAGGYAGMADQGDDDKSGYSDAFKRACAKFGVARYLYRDGVPCFVRERYPSDPAHADAEPDRRQESHPPRQASHGGGGGGNGGRGGGNAPRTGKALFAWVKEQEQTHEVGLLKYLNSWAKHQEFPGRMIDWDGEQVALALEEARRKLQSCGYGPGEDGGHDDGHRNDGPSPDDRRGGPPRDGRALFKWATVAGRDANLNLVKTLNEWAKGQGDLPGRMIDWDAATVARAYDVARDALERGE